MAGKLRHWKEKDGRLYARITVPSKLRPFLDRPRSELVEALGGDRRVAIRLHSAAVARLQRELAVAAHKAKGDGSEPVEERFPLTTADFARAVWQRYTSAINADEAARAAYPTEADLAVERTKLVQKAQTGAIRTTDPLAVLDASLDVLWLKEARTIDQRTRKARLQALKRELAAGKCLRSNTKLTPISTGCT